MNIDN